MMPVIHQHWSGSHYIGSGFGQDANNLRKKIQRLMQRNSPAASIQVRLAEVIEELDKLQDLEVDWDGEDAPAIDTQAIIHAKRIVSEIAAGTELAGLTWQHPAIAPMRSGGVSLSWHLLDSLQWLIFEPKTEDVIYISSEKQRKPARRILSPKYAVYAILEALSNQ